MARHLGQQQPDPDRVEHGFQQQHERSLECWQMPHRDREERVGERDLKRAQVQDRQPVCRGVLGDRPGKQTRRGECDQITCQHRGQRRALLAVVTRQPANAQQRQCPAQARDRREHVAEHRSGCGRRRRIDAGKEQQHPEH